ncbi:MAG: extracellular solute-binding protein [Thiolinea sp.]
MELLTSGQVAMSSGYNGRFFEAQSRQQPLIILWDGQIIDRDVWAIPRGHGQLKPAVRAFLQFALAPQQLAQLAERIPYGPTRASALERIGTHPQRGPMRDHLPTAPHHRQQALLRDTRWYARTADWREREFCEWLERPNE